MDDKIKLNICEALREYMDEHQLTQGEISKKMGINHLYIAAMRKLNTSVIMTDNEIIISDKYFEKVADFIGYSYDKNYWPVRPTPQLKMAMAALEDARKYGYIRLIIGETGSGKTLSTNLFVQANPSDVVSVKISSMDGVNDILLKVCDKLGVIPKYTKAMKLRDIIRRLQTLKYEGKSPVIIFDESEYMRLPTLCMIKELYDHLHKYCGIVLAGTNQLLDNIDKLIKKGGNGIPQFWRRIKFCIVRLPEIQRDYSIFVEGYDARLKKFIKNNCDNYGELHDVIVPCLREADNTGEAMTEDFVRKVLNIPAIPQLNRF